MRPIYYLGILYLAFTVVLLAQAQRRVPYDPVSVTSVPNPEPAEAPFEPAAWFHTAKPYCNPVEVEVRLRFAPPPDSPEGWSFAAACYALAGRIDRAREILEGLPSADRWRGAGIVFDVAHPVADAGDDEAAGPIMELVVEFWPNHYMALYHAGASNYAMGNMPNAIRYLRSFLAYYAPEDGWRANAVTILAEIDP
jgi:tetratricopeptide (TPR) repeat protein